LSHAAIVFRAEPPDESSHDVDYPAEHWIHLRTTNPIESTFASVRLRQRVTRAPAPAPPVSP
jgi:transposase-like protein